MFLKVFYMIFFNSFVLLGFHVIGLVVLRSLGFRVLRV